MEIADDVKCPAVWNYRNAFFFTGTIGTTIGYGNVYPSTNSGKVNQNYLFIFIFCSDILYFLCIDGDSNIWFCQLSRFVHIKTKIQFSTAESIWQKSEQVTVDIFVSSLFVGRRRNTLFRPGDGIQLSGGMDTARFRSRVCY